MSLSSLAHCDNYLDGFISFYGIQYLGHGGQTELPYPFRQIRR